jgi:hypothetical protein
MDSNDPAHSIYAPYKQHLYACILHCISGLGLTMNRNHAWLTQPSEDQQPTQDHHQQHSSFIDRISSTYSSIQTRIQAQLPSKFQTQPDDNDNISSASKIILNKLFPMVILISKDNNENCRSQKLRTLVCASVYWCARSCGDLVASCQQVRTRVYCYLSTSVNLLM